MYVQLMVVYVVSEHQDDSFSMCSNVKGEVELLSIRGLEESLRAFEVLSNTIRPHFTGTDSECLNNAFINYVNLWQEGKTHFVNLDIWNPVSVTFAVVLVST